MKKIYAMLFAASFFSFGFSQYTRNDNQNSNPYFKSFERISAGESFSIELRNGTLWGAGKNNYGQLGIGSTTSQSTPVQIGTSNDWHIFSTGRHHVIAIKSDGTLWGWGNNGSSQLGDGTVINRTSPIQIGTDNKWVMVATGETHSMALKSDGTLWSWGNNASGKLGIGNTINQTTPVQVGTSTDWKSIYSGSSCSFAIKANGTLWAWGLNSSGLYGNGTTTSSSSPIQIGTDDKWIEISCKTNHVLGLKTTGELLSWGTNTFGQLGNGNTTAQISPVSLGNGYQDVAAGSSFSYAIKNGQLYSWGWNSFGQLGLGTTSNVNVPTLVDNTENTASISCGYYSCHRLFSNSELHSTGYNVDGELGIGSTTTATSFTYRSSNTNGWLNIHLSDLGSYFIKQNGTIWMTGNNVTTTPIQMGTDNDWVSLINGKIDPSGFHVFYALKANGTLWQYYNGTYTQLGAPFRFRSIWGSSTNPKYAIAMDGSLWSITGTNVTLLNSGPNWVSACNSAVIGCLIALKNDGTVWTYGTNNYGIYGNGTTTTNTSFNQVSTSNAIGVFACNFTAYALLSNGTTKGWGHNTLGEIGNGSTTNATSPSSMINGTNIIQFDVDNEALILAIKSDGNLYYQSGTGSGPAYGNGTNFASTLTLNPNTSNVILVNAGWSYSAICTSSRTGICLTGENTAGQLGDGTTTSTLYYSCSSVVALKKPTEDFISNNTLETSLGLTNHESNTLSIYPNPSSGMVFFTSTSEITLAEVLDIKGNMVFQETGESINKLNLSDLPKGTYFIRLQCDAGLETYKLILM